MNTERPKLKIALTPADKAVETIGWLTLALLWVYTINIYSGLPEKIPTHFNIAGHADAFGSKASIFTLPIIGTILFLLLSVLNMFPQIFNYPKNITEENALQQYRNATRMVRYLKFSFVFIFSVLVSLTSEAAGDNSKGFSVWYLPILLVLILGPLLFFVIRSFKIK